MGKAVAIQSALADPLQHTIVSAPQKESNSDELARMLRTIYGTRVLHEAFDAAGTDEMIQGGGDILRRWGSSGEPPLAYALSRVTGRRIRCNVARNPNDQLVNALSSVGTHAG